MELKGTIHLIGEIETFGSGFQKRQLVLMTGDQYPSPVAIDFLKDKIDLLNGLKLNDEVTASINIGGREWTSPAGEIKYFNSVTGWKIKKDEAEPTQKKAEPKKLIEDVEDDLPF